MFLASASAALLVSRSLSRYPPKGGLAVRNFRGVETPVTGGLVLLVGLMVAEGLAALVSQFRGPPNVHEFFRPIHFLTLALALGFFALGAVDDLTGAGSAKGLLGHLKSLSRGEITGGIVKAGGGLALSFAISRLRTWSFAGAVLDAVIISLFANLFNLFDLRPGRSVKIFLAGSVLLLGSVWVSGHGLVIWALVGAAIVWLPVDLKEKGMLGDSGANMLGAVLGAGVAFSLPQNLSKLVMLVVLLGLTLVSEKWSFGDLIERVPPLRWFDRLGRMP